MARNWNNSGEVSKNGPCRGDPNRSCVFSTLPLLVFVYSISTYWEKSGMLTLKTNLSTYCQKSPIRLQSLFFHMLFKDWVVVWGVFSKLRFGERSKKFGNRCSSHFSVSGWNFFHPWMFKWQNPIDWDKIQFNLILVKCALSRKEIANYL